MYVYLVVQTTDALRVSLEDIRSIETKGTKIEFYLAIYCKSRDGEI